MGHTIWTVGASILWACGIASLMVVRILP